jgi:hypothetical protein
MLNYFVQQSYFALYCFYILLPFILRNTCIGINIIYAFKTIVTFVFFSMRKLMKVRTREFASLLSNCQLLKKNSSMELFTVHEIN